MVLSKKRFGMIFFHGLIDLIQAQLKKQIQKLLFHVLRIWYRFKFTYCKLEMMKFSKITVEEFSFHKAAGNPQTAYFLVPLFLEDNYLYVCEIIICILTPFVSSSDTNNIRAKLFLHYLTLPTKITHFKSSSFSTPLENIRETLVFGFFRRGYKKKH